MARAAAATQPTRTAAEFWGLQAAEDVVAQAGGADRSGKGGGPHHPDRGRADAGDDHRGRQRQLHPEEPLAGGHAQALGGFQDVRGHPQDAGDGIAQDRQHAVEQQGNEGGQKADLTQQRDHEGQQGQPGDGLGHAGNREHRPLQGSHPGHQNGQGQAQGDPAGQGHQGQGQVMPQVVGKKSQLVRQSRLGHSPSLPECRMDSTWSAWRLGVSIRAAI